MHFKCNYKDRILLSSSVFEHLTRVEVEFLWQLTLVVKKSGWLNEADLACIDNCVLNHTQIKWLHCEKQAAKIKW
jgi:hypothetical protein